MCHSKISRHHHHHHKRVFSGAQKLFARARAYSTPLIMQRIIRRARALSQVLCIYYAMSPHSKHMLHSLPRPWGRLLPSKSAAPKSSTASDTRPRFCASRTYMGKCFTAAAQEKPFRFLGERSNAACWCMRLCPAWTWWNLRICHILWPQSAGYFALHLIIWGNLKTHFLRLSMRSEINNATEMSPLFRLGECSC